MDTEKTHRRFRVRLHLSQICMALGRADREDYPPDYVIAFLLESGFAKDPLREGWWLVDEPDLGALRPEEVDCIEPA